MSRPREHCRSFASGRGCRRARCPHLHVQTGPPAVRTPSSSTNGNRGGGPARATAPRGICNFYWSSGECHRGFECAFQHDKPSSAGLASSVAQMDAKRDTLDLCTTEGLADMNNIPKNRFHNLKPSDAHNAMRVFVPDERQLDRPGQMIDFANIIASVDRRNAAWNSDHAQAFLDMIVRGNPLRIIGQILQYTNVSNRAGMGFTTLSFQRGYFPVLQFLTSDLILKTTLHHNINALYTVIDTSFANIYVVLEKCMQLMIEAKSWKDPTPGLPENYQSALSGVLVFNTLATLLTQFFLRFKKAIRSHPEIIHLVNNIVVWFDTWAQGVSRDSHQFDDAIDDVNGELTIQEIRRAVTRLQDIAKREHLELENQRKPVKILTISKADRAQALLTRLKQTYDPPGTLREGGLPRHDNDAVSISDIRIVPTHQELMSNADPYLPINLPDAPHHCPRNSMERHLDIQFRLLREELISPIRQSLSVIQYDVDTMNKPTVGKRQPTKLEELLAQKGGMYRTSGYNSVMFQVYTNIELTPLRAERSAFTVGLIIDAPPGSARDSDGKKRQEFWKHGGSKRLTSGSIVAMVVVTRGNMEVNLGTVASSNQELVDSSNARESQVEIRVKFFDVEVELKALRRNKIPSTADNSSFALIIDNNIMFESIRPFLQALRSVEPTSIPFSRYISSSNGLDKVAILPPKYSTAPAFRFNLECLAKNREYIHPLQATDPGSIERASRQLKSSSILDASQCKAVVDALTREVALIQGPPGTGKSFTGKEILRVLFANKVKPVILISVTNNALDHMLLSMLDAKITTNLVRLGSRSSNERVAEYTLDKLEKLASKSSLDRSMGREYGQLKRLEESMRRVLDEIQIPEVNWSQIEKYLGDHYPGHLRPLTQAPYWIFKLAEQIWESAGADSEGGEWETVTKKTRKNAADHRLTNTFYGFWKHAQDLIFLQPPTLTEQQIVELKGRKWKKKRGTTSTAVDFRKLDDDYKKRLNDFFGPLGFAGKVPPIPKTARRTDDLLRITNIWSMSTTERLMLAQFWEDGMRSIAYNSYLDQYYGLREEYEAACQRYNDAKDEARRRLLCQADLIGCTTNGAAKLTSLLTTVGPKVLMVEEAGQVLEAHVLASLVPSVQHLICIGDPQQLRPTLANYNLSMDSERGRELYLFDRSLMERLSNSEMPMSQINVQRRMRPTISHHIRSILYPQLEDHEIVQRYPHVQGMQKDVFWFTHTNKENGGDEASVSKCNMFEVAMIVDLVLYFLKQDAYTAAGDIAVLCAYLGQLQKVKAALKSLKVAVSVDERDQEQLARQGLEEDPFEQVAVASHIRLGTVDIFQGQEAKIVIVSLVRNSGSFEGGTSSIGFLKSSNRINVALSRAQHGLYIMGNASNLRQNPTWQIIIDEMERNDQIGFGFPIVCPRHHEQKNIINKPGQLPVKAPEGGCLLPCRFRMSCGHNCTHMCHHDRDQHRSMKCVMPCIQITCPRAHPCPLLCFENCGACQVPVYNVKLKCGHVAKSVPCHQYEDLASVKCREEVQKQLPQCEHSAKMPCFLNPEEFVCEKPCGGTLLCCSKTCKSRCADCLSKTLQVLNSDTRPRPASNRVSRSHHKAHPCERSLYCQHRCGLDCSSTHECITFCRETCRQRCAHHQCEKYCGEDCAPCAEPCEWCCPHLSCPVLCGSICARLPCDKPCRQVLGCGHACPSVCGEPCAKQKCVSCLSDGAKTDIVDLVMQRTLSEIEVGSDEISERLITLDCGHIFTVETLDGHCMMSEYYEVDQAGSYVSMKAPPIDFQHPPACPTCRSPITTRRYGRVTKRANLDILEHNVASNMSQSLADITPAVEVLSSNLSSLETSARGMQCKPGSKPKKDFIALSTRREGAFGKADEVLPQNMLTAEGMIKHHGFAAPEAKAWLRIVGDLQQVYEKVANVAKTRTSHMRAYEAALSTLYRLALSEIANDPSTASQPPEPLAMEAANKMIGQPPPKADRRYHLEAFLLSVELRFMLGQLARGRLESLPSTSNDPEVTHHRVLWASFIEFVYRSCIVDCRKSIDIADCSSSSRLAARAATLLLRSEFEHFRFLTMEKRLKLIKEGKMTESRNDLVASINAKRSEAEKFLERVELTYLRTRPSGSLQQLMNERRWFTANCRVKAERCLKEYKVLEDHAEDGTLYQAMSIQEMEDIVQAFGFTHRGHFYKCREGHTFVITECGGAMETSRCPECGSPIGGAGHSIDSSNTRAREFEEIAGRQGAEASPWRWAAGA